MSIISRKKNTWFKWLYPGLGVKRWAVISGLGLAIIVLGLWSMVDNRYTKSFTFALVRFLQNNLPDLTFEQGLFCMTIGIAIWVYALINLFRQYLQTTTYPTNRRSFYQSKTLAQGPKIVVIGGGTGLSVLLSGLKAYSANLTAAVTVGDDGGSSGRLREQYGVVPVGDIRNCIVALADEEDMMENLFNYRFSEGDELKGHSLGNLLLLALTVLQGSFQDAVSHIDQILHIQGRVLPIATKPLTLKATLQNGEVVIGESKISAVTSPIAHLELVPNDAVALVEVLRAIDEADAIILGPGSLYTSIIPNLLVPEVVAHIEKSTATRLYICNVMTQPGETGSYTAEDHLTALQKHSSKDIADYVVVHDQLLGVNETIAEYLLDGASEVAYDLQALSRMGVAVIEGDLASSDNIFRHDAEKLAAVIMKTLYKDGGFRKRRGYFQCFIDYQRFKSR